MTNEELRTMALSVLKRFFRAFVAGGLAQMASLVSVSHDIGTLTELEAWALTLAVAFITGGVLALDKLMRWQE